MIPGGESSDGDTLPAAQQATNLAHHGGHMLVLPGGEPAPACGQPEVEAYTCQCLIGEHQAFHTGTAVAHICLLQPLTQVKGRVEQPACDGITMGSRKVIGDRHKPCQQIIRPRKNRHLLAAHIMRVSYQDVKSASTVLRAVTRGACPSGLHGQSTEGQSTEPKIMGDPPTPRESQCRR